ncbi:MAG: hypothetical protein E6K74_03380 [Candidatus Eisenbacteria bacterium]|nr:MAG: hypothetical protein E6K74_03380 [Candidatus Eisenbacteria bacterium]
MAPQTVGSIRTGGRQSRPIVLLGAGWLAAGAGWLAAGGGWLAAGGDWLAARVGMLAAVGLVVLASISGAALGPRPAQAASRDIGEETRALWVVRYSLNSIGSVDRVVEIATQMNVNTLLVQIRGRGDAYYQSDLAPRGEELESMPREYDPFLRMIERAHAQGLEVQAWINV